MTTERAVHPAAAVFPMLSDDELRDLADDIKANGLLHPIVIDADGAIVDGRNRYAACIMAGVEPRYEMLDGHDACTFILSANIRRRHMSKGQQAIAIAMMIETEEGKRDGQTKALRLESNLSRSHVTQALTIRRYAPDLAPGVLAGTEPFDTAYEAAGTRKREREQEVEARDRKTRADVLELERLRRDAPDLAALVPDSLSVSEATAAHVERQRRDQQAREATTQLAAQMLSFLDPGVMSADEAAVRIVAMLDASLLPSRPDFSAARFERCGATFAAILAQIAERSSHAQP